MSRNDVLWYLVEGETERKIIASLKNEHIYSGKVFVRNIAQNLLNDTFLRGISPNTQIILVFDTDVDDKKRVERILENIDRLKKSKHVKKVILIPQVRNLEEELLRATGKKHIKDLISCKSNSDFKRDVLKIKDVRLRELLVQGGFQSERFWSGTPKGVYADFENESHRVKIDSSKNKSKNKS